MHPETIGPYEIIDKVGHGGMANVYRASQPNIGREVAVKVLPAHFLQDETFLKRFSREVHTIARLQHPRILPVYDFGEDGGVPYIVMAYIPGGTLADHIYRNPNGLSLPETSRLIDQIAEGLDFAHEKGIIHRDFKPSNVLLDEKGNVYIADFGIARVAEATAQLTGSGLLGTPAYMAPEMTERGGLTYLVDIYALGVTLFQMLTGQLPFEADTPMGTAIAHVSRPIPDIRSVRPDLPENLQSVINRALAKDPTKRYQSAGELADGLRQALTGAVSVRQDGLAVAPAPEAYLPLEPQPDLAYTLPEVAPTLPEFEAVPIAPVLERPANRRKPWLWAIVGGGIGLIALVSAIIAVLVGKFAQPTEPAQERMGSVAEEPSDTPEPTEEPTETPLPTESPEPTETPLPPGFHPVTHNSDWEPVIEEINGVPMALVPTGCFQMGSTDGDNDEEPVHEVCFEEPFWIDVYEVTNEQYGSSGEWSGDDLPRETVSWFDAVEHCERRGARLPTEAEWEYATRGPDSLVYPWGEAFECSRGNFDDETSLDDYTVPGGAGCDGYNWTAPVGSFEGGASWIGARDLGGNVWEWVNDWYDPDYYSSLPDGVVNPQGPESGEYRVLRGGSWFAVYYLTRAAGRFSWLPVGSFNNYGFRCARSYSP